MTITARYPGTCHKCGDKITPGMYIEWDKSTGRTAHSVCDTSAVPTAKSTPADEVPAPYKISGGSGYGCNGWAVGRTLHTSDRQRQMGYPEYITVVRSGSRCIREDGLSFGVGDESGYTYWAECREATPEEAAPVIAAREAREARKAAKAELEALVRETRDSGERPEGEHTPEGERILDTQTIYGGGDWWVIGEPGIWYCQNNGADGDNWAYNNVRTGGAGAIGWRLPYSDDLAAKLRRLAAALAAK